MPGSQRIDSIIDQQAVNAELKNLLEQLQTAAKVIKDFPQITSVYKDSNSASEMRKNTDELIKINQRAKKTQDELSLSMKQYENIVNQQAVAQARYNAGQSDAAKTLAASREQLRLQNLETKNTVIAQQAAEGSIIQMRAQLALLTKQYDSLGLAQRNSVEGVALQGQIKGLSGEIYELEQNTNRYSRNVGNYSSAFTGYALGLRGVRGPVKLLGEALGIGAQEADQFRLILEHSFQAIAAFFRGKEAKAAAETTDTAATAANTTANAANTTVTETNTVATGENVEAEITAAEVKAMNTVAAIELSAATAGLVTIKEAETLVEAEQAAAIEAVSAASLQAGASMLVEAAAQSALTVATTATTAATRVLRIALISLGIGAVIGVIAMLVVKIIEWRNEMKEAMHDQKMLNDITEKAADSYGKERASLDVLILKLKDEHVPRKQKLELLKELHDKYPGYFDDIKTEKELIDKLPAAYEKAAEGVLLKAKAEAASSMLAENYTKKTKTQIEYNNLIAESTVKLKHALNEVQNTPGENAQSMQRATIITDYNRIIKEGADDYSKTVEQIDKDNKFLANSIVNSDDEILKLGGKVTDKKEEKPKKEKKDEDFTDAYIKQQQELIKAKAALSKLELEEDAKKNLAVFDDEQNALHKRLDAYSKYVIDKQQLEKKSQEEELSEISVKLKKIAEIESKSPSKRTNEEKRLLLEKQTLLVQEEVIQKKHADAIEDINREAAKKVQDVWKKEAENLRKDMEYSIGDVKTNKIVDAVMEETQALDALNKKLKEGKISSEEFTKAHDKIIEKATLDKLQAEMDSIHDLMDLYSLLGYDLRDLKLKEAELHQQIEERKTKTTETELKKREEAEKKASAAWQDVEKRGAEAAKELFKNVIEGTYDNQLNKIQDQIDANTKWKDAETERINSSTLSETDKAARLAQLQATSQAREDQMNQKKKETELKKAKFDREMAIMEVVINTAQAIAKAVAAFPETGGMPFAAIDAAIGATQIAAILSKPLPKFEKGTSASPEGFGLTDERGPELYIKPGGEMFLGSNEPNIKYLERNTQIIPYDRVNEVLLSMMLSKTASVIQPENNLNKIMQKQTELAVWQTEQFKQALKAGKKTTIVNNRIDTTWGAYIQKQVFD